MNILRIAATPLLNDIAFDATNEFPVLDIDAYEGSPSRIAQMVRSTWRMPMGPVSNMVAVLESAGGIVYRLPFGTRQLDAVSHWPPHMVPLFLLNSEAPPDRARFSLAHELGHIVMHRVPNRNMEREADQFASEFLMPAREIRSDLRGLDLAQAAQLKSFWKVSMAALIMKARDTETITPSRAKRLFAELSRLGYRTSEPVEIAAEKPTLLDAVIETHRRDHKYGVAELVELAGIPERGLPRPLSGQSASPSRQVANPQASRQTVVTILKHPVSMNRLSRTGFSKKAENHVAAVALYTMHYNLARQHKSLSNPYPRIPAMAASIAGHVSTCEEIAALLD